MPIGGTQLLFSTARLSRGVELSRVMECDAGNTDRVMSSECSEMPCNKDNILLVRKNAYTADMITQSKSVQRIHSRLCQTGMAHSVRRSVQPVQLEAGLLAKASSRYSFSPIVLRTPPTLDQTPQTRTLKLIVKVLPSTRTTAIATLLSLHNKSNNVYFL
jgi:hypothetical protein